MITISRRLAQQFRAVVRRALGQVRVGPAIGFIADKEGLTVKSTFGDVAVELRVPGARAAETVWLPFQALEDFEAKKDDPVQLTASDNGQVTAEWRDGNVPQIVQYDSAKPLDADTFPALPTDFTTNPPELLRAMHEASEVATSDSVRFALDCLQLCPDGTINVADGRQALIQSGFAFPWKEPLLVPRSKVFHSPELPQDKPVAVARSGDWLALGVDPWTICLRINKDGRFPDMARVTPNPANATARCQLSEDDRKFLADTLPRLPGNEEQNSPVTLDLNGHVAVRAKSSDQAKPTEIVLTNSTCSGEPIRININRIYLKRATKLGVRDVCLYGAEAALLGQGENCQLVWMPLDAESAIAPKDDMIRIESPKAEASAPASTSPPSKSKTERKPKTVSDTTPNTNGHAPSDSTTAKPRRRKTGKQDLTKLIDQATKFRTAAHDLMHEAAELVRALKQHRRANKAVETTLATLKSLGV